MTSTSCRSGRQRRPARRRRTRVVIAARIGGAVPVGASGAGRLEKGGTAERRHRPEVRPQLAARESRSAALRTRLGRPSAPSRVLLAVGGALNAALLHDRGPSKFLRQTAPQLELTGSAGLVVSQRLADAADGLREGPGRPSADGWCRMEFAHHLDICIASRSRLQPHGHSNQAERSGRPIRICMRWCSYDAGDGHDLLPPDLPPMPAAASA